MTLRDPVVTVSDDVVTHRAVEDYELVKQLYRGKASLLYKATCRYSRQTVALKLYRKPKLSSLNWYQVTITPLPLLNSTRLKTMTVLHRVSRHFHERSYIAMMQAGT